MKQAYESSQAIPIRVLLVDDHPIVREGIRSCLSEHTHIQIVGEAADGFDAIDQFQSLQPDVVLMDIGLPQMNGLETTRRLVSIDPSVKILILTMHNNPEYLQEVLRIGALGYVLKDSSPRELLSAIEHAFRGQGFISPSVSASFLIKSKANNVTQPKSTLEKLTEREIQVLKLIADGRSNKETADNLGVSVRTVESHREAITRKLQITSIAGLTKFALSQGLTEL